MSEMVERAALAILQPVIDQILRVNFTNPAPQREMVNWDNVGATFKNSLRIIVRAAIAAMREPTEAMASSAFDFIWQSTMCDPSSAEGAGVEVWKLMIDAALKE